MQRLRAKWWMPLSISVILMLWSTGLSSRKFISLHQPLVIKAQKNSPPHVAFEALLASDTKDNEWAVIARAPIQELAATKLYQTEKNKNAVQLAEMVITKSVQPIAIPERTVASNVSIESRSLPVQMQPLVQTAVDDRSWIQDLNPTQRKRLQEAQQNSEVLEKNWEDQSWTQTVQRVISQNTPSAQNRPSSRQNAASTVQNTKQNPANQYAALDRRPALIPTTPPSSDDQAPGFVSTNAPVRVSGPIEISGGLAVTNEHHIEVRRNNEGVVKELGRVDLQKGLYNITVEDLAGVLVAQLIDREGRVLGEGQIRLNQASKNEDSFSGPKLRLIPQISIASRVVSAYGDDHALPANTIATFIKGAGDEKVGPLKTAGLENVAKGSATVMRVAGQGSLQTSQIVFSGEEAKATIFSESMMKALQEIIADHRKISLKAQNQLIWGQALLDGKPQSGVRVELESSPDIEAVYLNENLFPDFNLKSTSANGLYVFVDVDPGFHSILGNKGEKLFGYQNVEVEENSVAVGNVESSTQSETVPLRVYDAFSGEAGIAKVILQSAEDEVTTQDGYISLQLPKVTRLGLMQVQPEDKKYLTAQYVYNDKDSFLHAPLIQRGWLTEIKSYLRLDDRPGAVGVVVGFVPEENFEVYIAGYEKINPRQIAYFDMQGRLVEGAKGPAGGGFILYNIPVDTHEVVVIGEKTRKIYSRVLPVDAETLSVLSFR